MSAPEPPDVARAVLLAKAIEITTGDRNVTYGSPTQNFTDTAEMWTVLLNHKLMPGQAVTPDEVATLLIALKLARTKAQPKADNFLDIAGYAACGYEAAVETGRVTGDLL